MCGFQEEAIRGKVWSRNCAKRHQHFLDLHPSFHAHRHAVSPNPSTAAMAHPIPRLLSRRLCQPSSFLPKHQPPFPRNFRPQFSRSPARRTYATGESGPNPKPGQNPFKVWPFVAITLAGSGAYMLMVRSRAGMSHLLQLCCPLSSTKLSEAQFESRFNNHHRKSSDLESVSSLSFISTRSITNLSNNLLPNQICLQPPRKSRHQRKMSQPFPPLL